MKSYTDLEQSKILPLEKQNSNVDNANKEYWRGYREGKQDAELEKQGGNKPADKVETKFKKGDRLIHNERKNIIKVVNPTPLVYKVVDILGYHHTITDTAIESNYHLWTIQDAKDGDVLATEPIDGYPFPFVAIYKNRGLDFFNSYCFIGFDGKFYNGETGHSIENIYPAAEEQRDLLFSKMKEAGYEWDAENKQLKEIEQKFWGEEDERMFKSLNKLLNEASCYSCTEGVDKILSWLKSLRPQNRDTYNPYKEVVSSIAEMCDKYKSFSDDRANDFVNNVKVKCKDAKEYDSLYNDLKTI